MFEDSRRPRENYLEWDEYFMAVACLSSMRSKDPASQVGACIVNQVSWAYDSFLLDLRNVLPRRNRYERLRECTPQVEP
ncbi:unnamed protein product [Cyprideis torosa]|uniref:Uncharacterized protein n=1 Tax=Cyprideis torosa TaxID=163714 RepID=A0A7R8ZQN2_9CRUS|nr:unnamed protein product [Cyprideis torosa]CAG0891084.1 unnamed protein product [Cyprideis torosa]